MHCPPSCVALRDALMRFTLGTVHATIRFSIKLGLDACGKILFKSECGSDLTKRLPFWILDKAFDFEGAC